MMLACAGALDYAQERGRSSGKRPALKRTRSCVTAPYEVLVIDDEPGDVDLVRRALLNGPYDCHVTVANDGVDGLKMIRQDDDAALPPSPLPDLILLDMHMPRMDGCEFLETVKHDPLLAHIPVVMMTTSSAESDVDRAYDLGAAGFLTKPASVAQFDKIIHNVETYWFSVVRIPSRAI